MATDTQTTGTPPDQDTTAAAPPPPSYSGNPTRRFTYDQLDPYHKAIADRVANTLRVYNRILDTNDPVERETLISWLTGHTLTPEQRHRIDQEYRSLTEQSPVSGDFTRFGNFLGDLGDGFNNFMASMRRGWNGTFGHQITPEEARAIGTAYASALQSQSYERPRADHYFDGLFSSNFLQYGMAGIAWGWDWVRSNVASWDWLTNVPVVGQYLHQFATWLGQGPTHTLQEHIDRAMAGSDAQPVHDAIARSGRIGGVDGPKLADALTNGFIAQNANGQDVNVAPSNPGSDTTPQPEAADQPGTDGTVGVGNGVVGRTIDAGGIVVSRTVTSTVGRVTRKALPRVAEHLLPRLLGKVLHAVPLLGVAGTAYELNCTGPENADVVDGKTLTYTQQLEYDHEHGRIDDATYLSFKGLQDGYLASGLGGFIVMAGSEAVQMGGENIDRGMFLRYLPPSVVATITGDTANTTGEDLDAARQPTQPDARTRTARTQADTSTPRPAQPLTFASVDSVSPPNGVPPVPQGTLNGLFASAPI